MTEEHQEHAAKIALDFQREMLAKYEAGVVEHGGHLKDMGLKQLVDNIIEEVIDAYVYLHVLREKLSANMFECGDCGFRFSHKKGMEYCPCKKSAVDFNAGDKVDLKFNTRLIGNVKRT